MRKIIPYAMAILIMSGWAFSARAEGETAMPPVSGDQPAVTDIIHEEKPVVQDGVMTTDEAKPDEKTVEETKPVETGE